MKDGENPASDIDMDNSSKPDQNAYRFADVVHLFPEAEQSEANQLLSIYEKYMALFNSNREKFMEKYNSLNTFYRQLLPENNTEAHEISACLRQSKIYHLFFGSSMLKSQFTEFELYNHDNPDDPSYKLARFIYDDFSKDLE